MTNVAHLVPKLFSKSASSAVECSGAIQLTATAPEQKALRSSDSSGWLENYSTVRSKREYWYKRYSWRDATGKLRHKHVPRYKEKAIAALIAGRSPIDGILRVLR